MKKSLILILMFLLTLAACTPAGESPEPTAPEATEATAVPTAEPTATDEPAAAFAGLMQVYKNEEAGFSLRLPTDWTVSEAQEAPFGTVYLVGAEPLAQGGAANSSIVVADAEQMTAVQLAEQLLCGGGCDAPSLTEVKLRNGINAQFALIGGDGSPLLPWYFVENNGKLVALSFHDSVNTEQSLDAIVQSLVFGNILESGGEEMAPLQAARQALAAELGVNPYALVMESITSTEWPDSCLGVHLPEVMCAQMVTSGYAVTLSLRDQLYQVNSNVDGSQIVRVPASDAAYRPISDEACAALGDALAEALGAPAEFGQTQFTDYVSGLNGAGCQITLTGSGETFGTFLQVASQIDTLLTGEGWTQDAAYLADGPTGTATAFRLGDQLALFNVDWQPSADANCPTDQPISACSLTPVQQEFTITLNVAEMMTK